MVQMVGLTIGTIFEKKNALFQPTNRWRVSHDLGCFGFSGTRSLALISGKQKTEDYQVLDNNLLPLTELLWRPKWIFQQDNAPISGSTKTWFQQKNISVMQWPARSLDLNPIENVWGIMARQVYANVM